MGKEVNVLEVKGIQRYKIDVAEWIQEILIEKQVCQQD